MVPVSKNIRGFVSQFVVTLPRGCAEINSPPQRKNEANDS
jgi:hypothetical protein